jgi:TonB family protein
MGDSSPIDLRRRYARPGEFEVPSSVLESNAFKQRLGGQLNSDRTSPAPPSRQLTAGEASNPVRRDPAPAASEARFRADRDQQPRSALPPSREVRGGESHLRRNPAPVESEARLSVNLQQHSRTAVPVSRQLLPGGESHLRKNPAPVRPVRNDARLSVEAQPHPRSSVPVSRQLPPGGEYVRRDPAPVRPVRNDARLGVDAHPYRRSPAPLATRDAIAKRRTSARFELLPDPEPHWNRIGVSAAAQLAFLGLLLLSPMIFPQQMETALKYNVVDILQPVTLIEIPHPTPPPPPPKVKPKVQPKPIVPKPKPVEVQPPELNPKQPHVFLVLKPQLPKVHVVEAKPVDLKPIFAQAEIVLTSNQPKRPKEEMKAPILQPMRKEDIQAPGLGFGLPATVVAAASKVQTGGFGDPHGIRGPANPSKAANISQAGSPNLPGGPGSGNGTGGAQGARGTLASDGSKSNGAGTSGAGTGGATTGVAILSKPNPSYSIEARTIKLEGDVVLEVVFLASGQVQVIRVVSGLGHGLDDAAIQAAKLIRFRPAQRNGQPVDFHAHVRIEFRLAN